MCPTQSISEVGKTHEMVLERSHQQRKTSALINLWNTIQHSYLQLENLLWHYF